MAAVMIAANVIGILVNDREVVPDIAILGIGARLPAADAPAAERRFVAHHPVHRVDTVHGLLDDVVAREPAIVIPVAHLVLHVGAALLAGLPRFPDALRVVGRLDGDDLADLAVEDLLHGLAPRARRSASRSR